MLLTKWDRDFGSYIGFDYFSIKCSIYALKDLLQTSVKMAITQLENVHVIKIAAGRGGVRGACGQHSIESSCISTS